MRIRDCALFIMVAGCLLAGMSIAVAQGNSARESKMQLVRAVMSESVQENQPVHPAVVFSINIGRVSCFSSFDSIPENTVVFHKWYHREELSTQKKLTLKPPRWSTYSSIQLREEDKGPWRVEITDAEGHLLVKLRFSVTD